MNNQEIIALTDQFIMQTYGRFPVAFVKGEGCYLWDANGKKYLDWLGGIAVNALGHAHPEIVQVLAEQAKTLIHTSNLFYTEPQARLAQLLCEHSFADRVFFCNSGAEANEAAVKLARIWAKSSANKERYEVLTVEKSFHGRTLAMIAATGQDKVKKGFAPLPEGFRTVPFHDLEAMKAAVGPKTCAIMVEPVLGEGGILFHSQEYFTGLRKLCDDHQLLLVFDEIQSGLGRTGRLWAHEHYGVTPDVLTSAKALGTGLPIGACLAREEIAAAFTPGTHATTYGGNPLVCAVAEKFLEILLAPGFLDGIRERGDYFLGGLKKLMETHETIREVRGKGMMLGATLSIPGREVVAAAMAQGLIINSPQENALRFVPPLILTKEQIDEGLARLAGVL